VSDRLITAFSGENPDRCFFMGDRQYIATENVELTGESISTNQPELSESASIGV
jgi:hypothetical protein